MAGWQKEGADGGVFPLPFFAIGMQQTRKQNQTEKKVLPSYSDEYSHVAHGRGPPPERTLRFELGHAAPPGAGSAHPPA
jgi:hypothetical protein